MNFFGNELSAFAKGLSVEVLSLLLSLLFSFIRIFEEVISRLLSRARKPDFDSIEILSVLF